MKNLTDEQLDLVVKKLLQDSALDSQTLDEIADSPKILWNIKREINQEKPKTVKGWIWNYKFLIPTFAAFSLLLTFGLFWSLNSSNKPTVTASVDLPKVEPIKLTEPQIAEEVKPISTPQTSVNKSTISTKTSLPKSEKKIVNNIETKKISSEVVATKNEHKIAVTQTNVSKKPSQKSSVKETKTEEYKTDFIALSYLPTPESGQIVRVKVPRAMMVSLGVTNNVSKNDELVNAEVIVADDGTSRAIRFISDGK
jgi:hypothetical protein